MTNLQSTKKLTQRYCLKLARMCVHPWFKTVKTMSATLTSMFLQGTQEEVRDNLQYANNNFINKHCLYTILW